MPLVNGDGMCCEARTLDTVINKQICMPLQQTSRRQALHMSASATIAFLHGAQLTSALSAFGMMEAVSNIMLIVFAACVAARERGRHGGAVVCHLPEQGQGHHCAALPSHVHVP